MGGSLLNVSVAVLLPKICTCEWSDCNPDRVRLPPGSGPIRCCAPRRLYNGLYVRRYVLSRNRSVACGSGSASPDVVAQKDPDDLHASLALAMNRRDVQRVVAAVDLGFEVNMQRRQQRDHLIGRRDAMG